MKSDRHQSGMVPHLLSMTATPIPRTLALTIFGDLDISLIHEKPKGRQPIETSVVSSGDRPRVYDFIRRQVRDGRQVFVTGHPEYDRDTLRLEYERDVALP